MNQMILKKLKTNDKAISPIIGTILMVAITVIMAAIISSWSSGIKAPETPTTVAIDISRLNTTAIQATITSISPPNTVISSITFHNSSATTNWTSPSVGSTTSIPVPDFNVFVTATANFADGTKKVLFAQRI